MSISGLLLTCSYLSDDHVFPLCLQPCLSGQGKTLMFVNVNPEPASANESVVSLKFAAKVGQFAGLGALPVMCPGLEAAVIAQVSTAVQTV